ncbi:MAG: hypothetical protein WBD74_03390 [Candidatus Aquilonibacter sp.]
MILGPVASYLLVRHLRREDAALIARLREDLKHETKRIDAERSLLEGKVQSQYSWLSQERVEAMREVYSALVEATDAFDAFTNSWRTIPGDTKTARENWLAATPMGQKFRDIFLRNSLLFPEDVATALGEINRRFGVIFASFRAQLLAAGGLEYQALTEMEKRGLLSLGDVREVITVVERAFRRLYGNEDHVATDAARSLEPI